jgi:hypothetical protein
MQKAGGRIRELRMRPAVDSSAIITSLNAGLSVAIRGISDLPTYLPRSTAFPRFPPAFPHPSLLMETLRRFVPSGARNSARYS